MELTKDEIFNIRYNTKLNRLEIKKKSWTSKLSDFFKNHILLSITIISFIIFSIIDILLIYNFMMVFNNI